MSSVFEYSFMKQREDTFQNAIVAIQYDINEDKYQIVRVYLKDEYEKDIKYCKRDYIWIPLYQVEAILGMRYGSVDCYIFKKHFNKVFKEKFTGRRLSKSKFF